MKCSELQYPEKPYCKKGIIGMEGSPQICIADEISDLKGRTGLNPGYLK
jgi:hypothetical protein